MKFCVSCKRRIMRLSKIQFCNKGYCTNCIKSETWDKLFNHYTGKKCSPDECFEVPDEQKSYKIKDVVYNVVVNFA